MRAALLALLVLPVSGRVPHAPGSAELRLEAGRAEVVQGRGVRSLTRLSSALELGGPAYVELGARSTLSLRWPGRGSARIAGPAVLHVEEGRLVLQNFEGLELEVRRGSLALELPGGDSLELGAGALGATSLPDGGALVRNRGGAAVEIRGSHVRTRTLRPGAALRLAPTR